MYFCATIFLYRVSLFDAFENPSKYLHDGNEECGIALLNSRNCVARNVRRRDLKKKEDKIMSR